MASKKSSVLGVACLAWGLLVAAPAFAGFRASGTYRRSVNCLTRMAEPQGASDSNSGYELWVDFRLQRLRKPLTSWGQPGPVSPAVASLQSPKVKEGLIDLANNLKEKFNKIGVELPKGKIMNGVVIDKKFAKEVLEEVRDMQIPVFTARKEVQGERMEGNSFFLCKAADGKPVACLEPKQIRLSSVQPHAAEDVYSLESDDVKADREKEEADYMERYREGLKDPSKYVLPPRSRMRELFGLPPEPRKPDRSRLLAKTIPPDALLWGRALMDRQRRGKVGYNLKSEVKNVAEAIAVTKVVDNQS